MLSRRTNRDLQATSCSLLAIVAMLGLVACGGGAASDGGATSDGGTATTDGGVATGDGGAISTNIVRAVTVAKTTTLPGCTVHVDAANAGAADGAAARPYRTIAAGITAATSGAVLCVAQGTYAEALNGGEKYFTLAGGFQSGQAFAVRDSSRYVTKALGNGQNVFLSVNADPGPMGAQLIAVDGFEITGYSQGVVRDLHYSQRFDLTNNFIHDNTCASGDRIGAAFALNNVTGAITGNVIARNACARGGGGALLDSTAENEVTLTSNRVEANAGTEPEASHGGGFYLLVRRLTIVGNEFVGNQVTGWGGGLFVGADPGQGLACDARLAWNVYRDNRAGDAGGGFFCDDAANCTSEHELYEKNCGGNILLDSGSDETTPTIAVFSHLTNVSGLAVGCGAPGPGVAITKNNVAPDSYSFTNSIFWGNAANRDIDATCGSGCANMTVRVSYSDISLTNVNNGVAIRYGAGNVASVDPQFVNAAGHDFHLKSVNGHFTAGGYVNDATSSPALRAGDPAASATANPARAGARVELGTYGNSAEASYVQ